MSSLVITVDAAADVVMSASPGATDIGITGYQEPGSLARIQYAEASPWLHGQTALSWAYDQTLLQFSVCPFGAASESEADELIGALRAALSRLSYSTTVARNGVSQTWTCDPGSVVSAAARTRINMDRPNVTEWNVTIPCYPVPS